MQKEKIRKILAENICVDVEDCTDNKNLESDLGADSLSMLAFENDIVEELGIDDSKLKYNFETVGELLDYINTTANS